MNMKTWAAALASAMIAVPMTAGSVAAVPINAFSSIYFLGDSLTDDGNAYDASFGQVPESPPYWKGRFSNGRVWSDRVGSAFKQEGVRTGNLAIGGALADGGSIPDIGKQTTQYRLIDRSKRGDRPLVSLWAGGNDIVQSAGKARARKDSRQAAMAIGDAGMSLRRAGVRDLMIFDMPDLGEIPKYRGNSEKSASASAASRVFNRQLGKQIDALSDKGVRVYTVGANALFEALLDDPQSFGIQNVRTPCLDEDDNLCTRRQGRVRAFFDDMHPNRVVHRALAEAALAAVDDGPGARASLTATAVPAPAAATTTPAPVPLPPSGLMLVAAVGVAGLRRIRRRTNAA